VGQGQTRWEPHNLATPENSKRRQGPTHRKEQVSLAAAKMSVATRGAICQMKKHNVTQKFKGKQPAKQMFQTTTVTFAKTQREKKRKEKKRREKKKR
jgi:hypothetical protein